MSDRKEALVTFRELIPLWLVHFVAFGVLIWKGYLGGASCFALFMASMVAFLSGARVERYRAELEKKLEGSDGTG